jgi:hypothetical protein
MVRGILLRDGGEGVNCVDRPLAWPSCAGRDVISEAAVDLAW